MQAGRGLRQRRGLGGGRNVSLDKVTLTTVRLGLTGRPDRFIKADGAIIVKEWKSAHTIRAWHRAQVGCYFLLIDEEVRIRPTHGFIVCGDGTRHRFDNTDGLRAWVLGVATQNRAARSAVKQPIPVSQCQASVALVGCGAIVGRRGCNEPANRPSCVYVDE